MLVLESCFLAAAFALVTPALIAWSPAGLYYLLAAFAVVSGLIGTVILRRLRASSGPGLATLSSATLTKEALRSTA
jgi:inositol transporter-like SP family MFS transporter